MIQPESGCTLAVMAIAGRNQNASESDPGMFTGSCMMPLRRDAVLGKKLRLDAFWYTVPGARYNQILLKTLCYRI